MSHAPADEYRARLSARLAAHTTLSHADQRLSYARLAVFAAGAILLVAAWRAWLPAWWIALPCVAFLVLVVRHDRIIRARDAAARAIAFYERGLSRIEDRWAGAGEQGERFQQSRASVRERPGFVWAGIALPAALERTHSGGRGDACDVAPGARSHPERSPIGKRLSPT